ncbi:MAG: hypothetical protein M1822_003505 [Bathelium mastoideum]|nr:MAG: hypothetical protein M1822_003505 [Bathelium mastoideum]
MAAVLPPEPVGWFFLVHEYLASTASFWKPYIDTLPAPSAAAQLGTPSYFQDEDLQWLGATNVLAAHWQRTRAWQAYWQEGLKILKHFDWPTGNYTWELFQWAATIFTSRSFTSQWLTSDAAEPSSTDPSQAFENHSHALNETVDQKTYRAYYRTSEDQLVAENVTLPLANGPFQVLFPGLDSFNHDHSAEVNWSFARDSFSVTLEEPKQQGEEVFNNYGRKANEELLMGYGFCIPRNPWDRFALAFKPPPAPVQNKLRVTHPELFGLDGWNSTAGTFYLPGPKYAAQRYHSHNFAFWSALPPTLIELVYHMAMQERGRNVSFANLEQYLRNNKACPEMFATSRNLLEQIQPMLDRLILCRNSVPAKPKNKRQANAQIYRDGQICILHTITRELRAFFRSARPSSNVLRDPSEHAQCSLLLTLPEVLEIWHRAYPVAYSAFVTGLEQTAHASDIYVLQQAGWEEDIWTLWLCWLLIVDTNSGSKTYDHNGETGSKTLVRGWTDWLRSSYLPGILDRVRYGALSAADPRTRFEALRDVDLGNNGDVAIAALSDLEDHLKDLMGIVRSAAAAAPHSPWGDAMWSEDLIAVWGLRITKYECIERSFLHDDGGANIEEGLLMYLHRMDGHHAWPEEAHNPDGVVISEAAEATQTLH